MALDSYQFGHQWAIDKNGLGSIDRWNLESLYPMFTRLILVLPHISGHTVGRARPPNGLEGRMQGENYEPQINLAGLEARSGQNRRRQSLFALVLLLTAAILLLVRYRAFWWDSLPFQGIADQAISDATQEVAKTATAAPARKNVKGHSPSVAEAETEAPTSAPVQEALLPPLQVVVSYPNGRRQTIVARDSAVHLSFSPETAEALVQPVQPVYPPLAQQSNLQGSVVLLARIGKDGGVDSVQVVSGPEILAAAAVQAVRQWRFKPHVEAGQATPAETRITVNFTISPQ